MSTMKEFESTSTLFGGNAPFIEELYERYLADPDDGRPRVARVFRLAARRRGRRRARAGRRVVHRARASNRKVAGRDGRRDDDAQAGARAAADQQVPHARHVPRRPRSAASGRSGRYIADLDLATYGFTDGRPRHRVRRRLVQGRPGADAPARPHRRAAGDVLPHARRRVHVHLGHARPSASSRSGSSRSARARRTRRTQQPPHPRAADRRGDARALPAHQVRRAEALLGRGRRHDDPDARPPDPARRRGRRAGDRDRHGASRPPQRARQHAGQDAGGPVLRVRRQARAGAAGRRRQVSPGLFVGRRRRPAARCT